MIHAATTAPWWVSNPGFADPLPYRQPEREPNFEPPASLKMLEGKIWSWELQRAIKILLSALMALARFTRWAMTQIRRWLHAAAGAVSIQMTTHRHRRVCSLGSAYRVRGPPRLLT